MMKNLKTSRFLQLFVLLVLTACSASKYMTHEDYNRISIGESIADVQVQLGKPYEVIDHGSNKQEYIYLERIPLGDKREIFRRYILTVDHEKVIDKKIKEEVTSMIQVLGG